MSRWLPIESAPVNTRILVCDPDHYLKVVIAHWGELEPWGGYCWVTDAEGPGYNSEVKPIKWQPLPMDTA